MEVVLPEEGKLRSKTMWKKPAAVDHAVPEAPRHYTSKTDSSVASSNSNIKPGQADVNHEKVISSEDIQSARSEVKEMDSLFKTEETPQGPTLLYSGLPAEKVAESVEVATKKLGDKLGVPEKGVTVVQRAEAKQPGLLTPLKSPSAVARKYPAAKPYVDDGIKATEVQERLRGVFNRRLDAIEKVLTGGKSRLTDPMRGTYRQNKADLHEILLTGDMLGKKFTPAELRSEFGANDAVIRAYNLTRSAYDHAYTITSRVRDSSTIAFQAVEKKLRSMRAWAPITKVLLRV